MRGSVLSSLCLSAAVLSWADQPMGRTDAATMDPYLPIRNSALQFELGVSHSSMPGYFAGDSGSVGGAKSGSEAVDYTTAGALTQINLRIHHGFVAGTEAILDVPYVLASGDARRPNPTKGTDKSNQIASVGSGVDTSSNGFGDWTMGVKSVYEPWGLGFYFALVLPVGEALGSGAYTNGDGQLNFGLMWDKTFKEKYDVMTNFVYGYDLPATNRQLDKQDSYSAYLRFSYFLKDKKYRPYLAFTYKGYGDYVIDKQNTADVSSQMVLTPGVDLNISGDFGAAVNFDYVLAGTGNRTVATPNGWRVGAVLRYFWFRY